jgi:hypothetical protein
MPRGNDSRWDMPQARPPRADDLLAVELEAWI